MNGAECYFCRISKVSVNVITGVIRSFVYTVTCFSRYPILPAVSTVTLTCPTLPGSRRLELITAAVQPQLD